MISVFQIINPVIPSGIGAGGNSMGPTSVGNIVAAVVGLLYIIGFITALIYLITGSFYWITSAGEKGNLESARNRITQAIIGLIVLFSSYAILALLAQFIGWEAFPRLPVPTISQTGSNGGGGGGGGNGDCSYAANGQYACYSLTECVRCVDGATQFNQPRSNCPAPCNQ